MLSRCVAGRRIGRHCARLHGARLAFSLSPWKPRPSENTDYGEITEITEITEIIPTDYGGITVDVTVCYGDTCFISLFWISANEASVTVNPP